MYLDFEKYKKEQFCSNNECECYGRKGLGNIGTKSSKHKQVYCKKCKSTWTITKDTFFYNLKKPISLILEVLLLLSEGMGVNAIHRVKGVKPETINSWILKASDHVETVSRYLKQNMHLTQCQIDEFWSFVYKKKESLQKMRSGERIVEIDGGL